MGHAAHNGEGEGVSNWLYLIGSVCFLVGTIINMTSK